MSLPKSDTANREGAAITAGCYRDICYDETTKIPFGHPLGTDRYDQTNWEMVPYTATGHDADGKLVSRTLYGLAPKNKSAPYAAVATFLENTSKWSLDCAFASTFALVITYALSLGEQDFNQKFKGLCVQPLGFNAHEFALRYSIPYQVGGIPKGEFDALWSALPISTRISWVNTTGGKMPTRSNLTENGVKSSNESGGLYTCHPFGYNLTEIAVRQKLYAEGVRNGIASKDDPEDLNPIMRYSILLNRFNERKP